MKTKTEYRDLDTAIGRAIRNRRIAMHLTLENVADHISKSTQQIHNYEIGRIRIPASVLYEIATALECSVQDLYPNKDQTPTRSVINLDSLSRKALMVAVKYDSLSRSYKENVDQYISTL